MKAIKILRVFVIFLILHSCIENNDDISVDSDKNNLTPTGKAFIEFIHSNPEWEKTWTAAQKTGTPAPNESMGVFSPKYGNFIVLPIINQNEITHVAFFPVDTAESRAGNASMIITKDQEQRPEFVRSFFATRCHSFWENKKMVVNQELKAFRNNHIDYSKANSRASSSCGPTVFPADAWVTYQYMLNGSILESAQYRRSELLTTLHKGLWQATINHPDVTYNYPGNNASIDAFVKNNADAIAREITAIRFYDDVMDEFSKLDFVYEVEVLYLWEPQAEGLSPEEYRGAHGHWPTEEKKEENYCPKCNKPLSQCICPEVELQVTIDKQEYELLEPYTITVHISGEKRHEVDAIVIQMTKVNDADNWRYFQEGMVTSGHCIITRTSFNPGEWLIRAICQLPGQVYYYSTPISVTELWPSIDNFKNEPVVLNKLKELWDKGVSFAKENQATHAVREYGAFILLNPDGTYSCKEVAPGAEVYLIEAGVAGSMTIYERDYVDLSDWNNPNRSIPLAVGLMHTHYPLTWAKAGFRTDVGPSSTDKSPNQELPGLVYDYTNNIKSSDPENDPNNPLKVWEYGPQRRTTK